MGGDELCGVGSEGVEALIDSALAGTNSDRAWLLTYAATSRSTDKAALDELLDCVAIRAGSGDDAALEVLLELVHRLRLADSAIRSRMTDAALADDVAQQTLIAVEHNIGSYGGLAHFRTWLYAVARNEALMMLRRRLPQPTAAPLDLGAARFTSIVANRLTIADVIDGLPAPYAQTLRLQLFEDLDYEGISARLQIPVGTVRSRLAKAKELLRQALIDAPL